MSGDYYNYQTQRWCPQPDGREVVRIGSDGVVYYSGTFTPLVLSGPLYDKLTQRRPIPLSARIRRA